MFVVQPDGVSRQIYRTAPGVLLAVLLGEQSLIPKVLSSRPPTYFEMEQEWCSIQFADRAVSLRKWYLRPFSQLGFEIRCDPVVGKDSLSLNRDATLPKPVSLVSKRGAFARREGDSGIGSSRGSRQDSQSPIPQVESTFRSHWVGF